MFVFRTDVHGYYASLDHGILYRQVREHVTDRRVLELVWSYLRRMVCEGGEYVSVTRESVRPSLSPSMGAPYLKPRTDLTERGAGRRPLHGRLGDPGQNALGVTACRSASEHDS